MLNDIDECKTQLNFHLSSSLSSNLFNSSNTTNNVQCIDSQQLLSTKLTNDQCSDEKNVLISLLPSSNSSGKLSWKFFEQVDSLDNQLRSDESSPPLLNGGLFLSSNTTDNTVISTTNDVGFDENTMNASVIHANSHSIITDQTLPQGCNRKSNGYAINGTIQTTEILSQTYKTTTTATATDDLNTRPAIQQQQQQQQQPQAATTFVFTSPTSTFKRKKKQQRLREEQEVEQQRLQQQQLYNNNLFKFGNGQDSLIDTSESAITFNENHKNTKETTTTITSTALTEATKGNISTPQQLRQQYHNHTHTHNHHQQQQQRQHHRINIINETKTVINNSLGAIIADTVAYAQPTSSLAGSAGTTRTDNGITRSLLKAHTLPAITKTATTNSTFITDGVVDLKDTTTKQPKSLGKSATAGRKRRPKMQASSSGGSGNTTTAKGNSTLSLMDDIEMHLGLLGWRKKCLYTLLVLLMLLIIVNLGLTLWILKVMEFSTEGMGQLKIVPGGIQLTGQALVMDMLRASTIRSRHGQPISIESSRNFSINTRDTNGMLENHLFLGHDKLECMATGFRINDTNGRNLFSVNRNEVTIGAHALRIDGEGGAIFRESIQTPHVRAEPGRELRLESPTRQLDVTAAKDINLQSRAGGIEISALEDVKLTAIDGSLRFESSKIFMPNLRTVQLPLPGTPQNREHLHRVYQLCVCANGKLFLAAPHSICAGDDTTVCR